MSANQREFSINVSIQDYRSKVDAALEQFFVGLPELLHQDLSVQSLDALAKLKEYTLRPGKRIRGSLAAFSYDYTTGKQYGIEGLQLAVALELAQSYLLVVDDVMDRSNMRRGLPTVHQLYLSDQPEDEKDVHLANMLAVNVGLIAQHLVNIVLARISEKPERVQEATLVLHKNIAATGFGQIDDASQVIGKPFTEADILRKYRMKSSYYTFVNPLQLGVILGGGDTRENMQEIESFGIDAGIAFQLKDDLLGVFGTSKETGKSCTDDLEEGKYTLLVQYALDHADAADVAYLKKVLGTPNISDTTAQKIQAIFDRCGAKQYAEAMIHTYADNALKCIKNSDFWNSHTQNALSEIVNFSINRTR
jgi:geranylgeranyl diphosphate synthase type I